MDLIDILTHTLRPWGEEFVGGLQDPDVENIKFQLPDRR